MALVWEHTAGKRRYQIRTAGRSIRLYTNGVLHSQYHPGYVFGGGVWDLLGLPALWSADKYLSGVLLLGLGGGAVVRQLHELVQWGRFVAIEQNPVHVEIARRFFGLDSVPAQLVEREAGRWIESYSGEKFELIIDDLFSDHLGEARRAISFSRTWYGGLCELLTDRGMLVVNFADGPELKRKLKKIPALKRDFECAYQLTVPSYGNAVAVFLHDNRTPGELARALKTITPRRRRTRLRYHMEKLDL